MSAIMAHGLSTPPVEDNKSFSSSARRSSSKNSTKVGPRGAKRTNSVLSHEQHNHSMMDGRHKRVWKACERCRMKKTKCDGESPCKRCKDDGLVCTAGSRKKTEFKQLPRGYAEVLENTQYALIATVQKLYAMVRNGESWELGEPELNDRGLPVIHNIAEKLGCIRPSPDLPCAFPEDPEEFAELQAQLEAAEHEGGDEARRKLSEDSVFSSQSRSQRGSSTESDHSQLSKEYNQMVWQQQQKQQQQQVLSNHGTLGNQTSPTPAMPGPQFNQQPYQNNVKQESAASMLDHSSFDPRALASPPYSDFQAQTSSVESPVFRNSSPFSPWSAGTDDFLAPGHMLDLTALYMRQTHQRNSFPQAIPRSTPSTDHLGLEAGIQGGIRLGDVGNVDQSAFTNSASAMNYMSNSDGTIRPNMLDCNSGFDLADQMDSIMFNDYENQGGMRMS